MTRFTHDVIVVGAGAAGLTAAGGCAMAGLRVALIERGAMGGDCLNRGCVPSKALLAAAARAAEAGARLGVELGPARVDFAAVMAHVHGAIATIAPVDSRERFKGLGVEVIAGEAAIVDRRTVAVDGRTLVAPRLVIATGSAPRVPDVSGLAATPHLTNETLWALDRLPEHLAILGGGAIGVEMAQAFRRLGAAVTLIDHGRILAREDPEAAAVVTARLAAEGVQLRPDTPVSAVAAAAGGVRLTLGAATLHASHLLVAAGRVPVLPPGLAAAGVAHGPDGIVTDRARRTTAPGVFAVGDCRAGPRFTHLSGEDGGVAVRRIAWGLPARAGRAYPRVAYTSPELAQLGLTEAEARAQGGHVSVTRQDFTHNDRAVCEGRSDGFLTLVFRNRRLVGVTIVGVHAGELLLPWSLAIAGRASPFALASAVVAYPQRSDLSRAAAFAHVERRAFGPVPRAWARLLARLRRL